LPVEPPFFAPALLVPPLLTPPVVATLPPVLVPPVLAPPMLAPAVLFPPLLVPPVLVPPVLTPPVFTPPALVPPVPPVLVSLLPSSLQPKLSATLSANVPSAGRSERRLRRPERSDGVEGQTIRCNMIQLLTLTDDRTYRRRLLSLRRTGIAGSSRCFGVR
jgi:hypothetical protein